MRRRVRALREPDNAAAVLQGDTMGARLTAVLQDLKDQCGATAADLTADEIEALVFACARVDNPFSELNAELMERPIRVCKGVYLWPVTAGAQVWLMEYASAWWGEKSAMYRWAQAFALLNARNPDAFVNLTTKAKARAAILKTALRLACHAGELGEAVNRAYGILPHDAPKKPKKSDPAEKSKVDFAGIVARLEVASGIPAKAWLWGRSVVSMMKSYAELSELSVAVFGSKNEEPQRELEEAVENLARVCAAIGERLKAR